MLDYKTFDHENFRVKSVQDGIDVLEMFSYQFYKKECAMKPRDDKWGGGLLRVIKLLESSKSKIDLADLVIKAKKSESLQDAYAVHEKLNEILKEKHD